jgi:hypothetical protein
MSKSTNVGVENTGYWNSGNSNSGDRNSGYSNSGYSNSGDSNSGNSNSGYWNSGDRNSGNSNSGNSNSGDWNSGAFNRDCPKMRIFEEELDLTIEEFYQKYDISMDIPLNRWIDKSDMTKEEKAEVEGWETMGGYLKTLEYKEACQKWWSENPDEHQRFLDLPHFNAEIFEEITGIDVESKAETIEIEGKKYTVAEIKKALNK